MGNGRGDGTVELDTIVLLVLAGESESRNRTRGRSGDEKGEESTGLEEKVIGTDRGRWTWGFDVRLSPVVDL